MKAFLKFLLILVILAVIGGIVYIVVSNENLANWVFAAALCGTAAVIAGMFLGMIMSIFTPMFGADSEKVQTIVNIFVWLLVIAGGVYLTILFAQFLNR